ncbi:MAG: hypothetical protein ACK5ME_09050 [Parahaliea sp.]
MLHFGFTLDKGYGEVKKLTSEFDYPEEKRHYFQMATVFFDSTDAFYEVKIGTTKEYKDLFLIRRAYLVYSAHSYKNDDPNNLDLWWKSIRIYPHVEENLIVRMR